MFLTEILKQSVRSISINHSKDQLDLFIFIFIVNDLDNENRYFIDSYCSKPMVKSFRVLYRHIKHFNIFLQLGLMAMIPGGLFLADKTADRAR